MFDYLIKGKTLTNIANSIRTKTGDTEAIPVTAMADKILELSPPVKRATGTILFDKQYKVISLGFVPDIVMFPGFLYPNRNGTIQICSSAAAFFTESVGYSITIKAQMADNNYLLYPGQTSDGFYVDGFYRQNGTGWDSVLDMPLDYVAIKYTE